MLLARSPVPPSGPPLRKAIVKYLAVEAVLNCLTIKVKLYDLCFKRCPNSHKPCSAIFISVYNDDFYHRALEHNGFGRVPTVTLR